MANKEPKSNQPFLRWTGSKRWLVKEYIDIILPEKFNNYHEPFLGSGSVFFHINGLNTNKGRVFNISDSNAELINCYIEIRDNPLNLISHLKKLNNTKEDYYLIRDEKFRSKSKMAARFIYLNRTSFNGIYRVNSFGKYNVPYGNRPNVDVVTENLLMKVSDALQGVSIQCQNFEEALLDVKKNDLVFLDPPYTVAHENNGFIEYNQKLFSWADQEKLKIQIENIIAKKGHFILTNASHNSILELYREIGEILKFSRQSKVGGRNKTRGVFNELIIHNIELNGK